MIPSIRQRSWRWYCRVRSAWVEARKGKGHLLEASVVLLLLVTVVGFVFVKPHKETRKISFYFKDVQVEANYHRQQIIKIHEERANLDSLEAFHRSAYDKISSEFEDALAKDLGSGAPRDILLQEICRETLHDLQGQYFASEGQNFDVAGPRNETVRAAVSSTIAELVQATKGARAGMRSCALFDVGSSQSASVLAQILDAIKPENCDTFVYETTSASVDLLERALEGTPHSRRVALKGFWNYTMDGRSAPFKVTTLDTLMAEQLQKDEYRQSDLIVARIGRMVDDSFWKEIHGGADTIERIAGRRINLSPLQGLDKFLVLKRLTMVTWESYTDGKLKEEVDYVAQRGYHVYVLGVPKMVRVDGHYWDGKYAGSGSANAEFGLEENSLGRCNFPVTMVAIVEGSPMNSMLQHKRLPCAHFKGVSCKCDNFRTGGVYDMC